MTTTPISGSGFNASTWLNQVKGTAPAPSPAPAPAPTSTIPPTSDILGISPDVLSLLQSTGPDSNTGNQLSTLLGDGGTSSNPLFSTSSTSSNPLSGVYNSLLYTNTTTDPVAIAIATANQQAAQSAAQTNIVQNLITGLNTASNAYNQTLLAQAQAVIDANPGLIA